VVLLRRRPVFWKASPDMTRSPARRPCRGLTAQFCLALCRPIGHLLLRSLNDTVLRLAHPRLLGFNLLFRPIPACLLVFRPTPCFLRFGASGRAVLAGTFGINRSTSVLPLRSGPAHVFAAGFPSACFWRFFTSGNLFWYADASRSAGCFYSFPVQILSPYRWRTRQCPRFPAA